MKYKTKITYAKAAMALLEVVDKCLTTQKRCDCATKVEMALRRLVKELTQEKRAAE